MAARCSATANIDCDPTPLRERIKTFANDTAFTPQHLQRLHDLDTRFTVGSVVFKVNGRGSAIVLADRVCDAWQVNAASVFSHRFGRKRGQSRVAVTHRFFNKKFGVRGNQCFWKRLALNQEKPVPIRFGEIHGGLLVHRERGRNVE